MNAFQHISFLAMLVLVPVLIGLYLYALRKKKITARKIGDENLVSLLTVGYNSKAYLLKFILLLAAAVLLIISLANPRKASGAEKINRNGIDVMLALDVSKSMLAKDVKPSRLERAKQLLGRLVDKLGDDRVGIVVFAGKSYLQMPLTGDHAAARMYLSSASTETVPTQGTVISDALKMCFASFNSNEKKYKAIVLVSDGEDHDEDAVRTAGEMAAEGVVICTVGFGSPEGTTIIDETTNQVKTDKQGNVVISKLNETVLKEIAEKGNGPYLLYRNTDAAVNTITTALSGMDQRKVTDESLVNYRYYFVLFLAAALFLLLAELFIPVSGKNKTAVYRFAVLSVFALSCSFKAGAQKTNGLIKEGNDAYRQGEFDKALGSYREAIKKDPENATAQFNEGNALYKSGKKEESVAAFDKSVGLLKTAPAKSDAFYNKAVVLQNGKKLPECIEAYKQALKLEPGNEDARQNLQKALQQQKQEQQKQEQEKQQQKKEQQKPRDDKQEQKQKQKPEPQPSKLTKKDAEEKLKALMQQEKNLQDKLHKINAASVNKPEKDW